MKLNNKGWGTLEMILLSAGLILALSVSIFFISKLYGSLNIATSNSQYIDLENKLETAAKKYIDEKNITVTGDYKISYDTLKNEGYIESFQDNDGNSCNGYVIVYKRTETILYSAIITCPNYQTSTY